MLAFLVIFLKISTKYIGDEKGRRRAEWIEVGARERRFNRPISSH